MMVVFWEIPKTVVVTGKHIGRVMRISDDRYDRERSSLDLALQFLRHGARTQTIRTWIGLSDDRIRKVFCSGCWVFNRSDPELTELWNRINPVII